MKYDAVFIRSAYGKPDSRLEKEIISLIKNNIKVFVIAWDRDSSTDKEHDVKIGNTQVHFYHIGIKSQLAAGFKKNLFPMIRFNKKVYFLLKKYCSDFAVIHASDFDTVIPSFIIKKKYGKKLVYDIYDYYSDSHHMPAVIKRIVKQIDTYIINRSDAVVLCNEKRFEQITPARPTNVTYIHNSPAETYFDEQENKRESDNRIQIAYIGGLISKGRYLKELVDTVSKDDRFKLLIGGYGEFEWYIQEMSRKYENIQFYGKMNYEDVLKLESTVDIMTALYDPSLKNHQYAAPNKFYEALMLGKPLIVAKGTFIDEIVENKEIGWVLNETSNNIEQNIKQILNKIVIEKNKLKDIGKKMKQIYSDNYQWEVMEERLILMYKELMK